MVPGLTFGEKPVHTGVAIRVCVCGRLCAFVCVCACVCIVCMCMCVCLSVCLCVRVRALTSRLFGLFCQFTEGCSESGVSRLGSRAPIGYDGAVER